MAPRSPTVLRSHNDTPTPARRHRIARRVTGVLTAAAAAAMLGGCVAVGVGLGAGAYLAHTEERGIGGVVSDTETKVAIMDAWLGYDPELLTDLGVMIYDGRVLVTGVAPDAATRQAALQLVARTSGARQVYDEVAVGPGRSLARIASDQLITKKLQTAMLLDPGVRSRNYHRRTVNGAVYVIGVARDEDERDLVIDMARTLSGVTRVVPYIALADDAPQRIARTAPTAGTAAPGAAGAGTDLPRGPRIATEPVTATPLPDLTAPDAGADNAAGSGTGPDTQAAPGAPITVTGAMAGAETSTDAGATIGPDGDLNVADAEIGIAITELWHRSDPELAARLGLLVRNGRVIITGVVPDEALRAESYGLAWQVDGVHEVYNEARIGPPIGAERAGRDRVLENRLAAMLLADPNVVAANYAIRIDAGVLHLLGATGSDAELARVVAAARSLDGIDEVVEHVAVAAPSASP